MTRVARGWEVGRPARRRAARPAPTRACSLLEQPGRRDRAEAASRLAEEVPPAGREHGGCRESLR